VTSPGSDANKDHEAADPNERLEILRSLSYFEEEARTACAAVSRAMGTRYGEHDT